MQQQKPNVLLVMLNEMRHDSAGCAGNPHVKTPNLDELSRKGVKGVKVRQGDI